MLSREENSHKPRKSEVSSTKNIRWKSSQIWHCMMYKMDEIDLECFGDFTVFLFHEIRDPLLSIVPTIRNFNTYRSKNYFSQLKRFIGGECSISQRYPYFNFMEYHFRQSLSFQHIQYSTSLKFKIKKRKIKRKQKIELILIELIGFDLDFQRLKAST